MNTQNNTLKLAKLTIFEGFYESAHTDAIDWVLESMLENEDITLDQADSFRYTKEMMDGYCKLWVEHFKDSLAECGLDLPSLSFVSLYSPREYNYGTDLITASMDGADFARMTEQLDRPRIEILVRERFSHRSGFHSFYSNEYQDWIDEVHDENEFDEHQTAAMLESFELPENFADGFFENYREQIFNLIARSI